MKMFCAHCREEIVSGDRHRDIPRIGCDGPTMARFHDECLTRRMIGGINHQLGRCICCGGSEPADPEGMTLREAARAAIDLWQAGRR